MNTISNQISTSLISIVDDGQFRYPVLTAEMAAFVEANGKITASNYEAFCDAVDCMGEKEHGTVGSQGMIDFCAALMEDGAEYVRLA